MAEVKSGKLASSKGVKHPEDNSTITGPRYNEQGYTPSHHGKGTNKKR